MKRYILDACALIAFLSDEAGADVVGEVFREAMQENAKVYMSAVNLLEVYYGDYRAHGKDKADQMLDIVRANLPITFVPTLDEDIFKEAGRFKARYKISLADSIALGAAVILDAAVVTADHPELDIVEESENIQLHWIR